MEDLYDFSAIQNGKKLSKNCSQPEVTYVQYKFLHLFFFSNIILFKDKKHLVKVLKNTQFYFFHLKRDFFTYHRKHSSPRNENFIKGSHPFVYNFPDLFINSLIRSLISLYINILLLKQHYFPWHAYLHPNFNFRIYLYS